MANDDNPRTLCIYAATTAVQVQWGIAMSGWLKLILALCVVAVAGAAYLYVIDPQLGRQLLGGTPLAPPATVTTAYKWRDAQGNWQLTDNPPPAGTDYKTLKTRSDDNIVPAFPAQKN